MTVLQSYIQELVQGIKIIYIPQTEMIPWVHIVQKRGQKMSQKSQSGSWCCSFKRREIITPLLYF